VQEQQDIMELGICINSTNSTDTDAVCHMCCLCCCVASSTSIGLCPALGQARASLDDAESQVAETARAVAEKM